MKVQDLLKESAETFNFDTERLVKLAAEAEYSRMKQLEVIIPKIDNALRNGEVISTAFEDIKYELNVFVIS